MRSTSIKYVDDVDIDDDDDVKQILSLMDPVVPS